MQSVFAGQLAPGAVVTFAVTADCAASGTVTSRLALFTVIGSSAESVMSAAVAALPVLVVIIPVIEAGTRAGVRGTVPSELLACTPVITVAA